MGTGGIGQRTDEVERRAHTQRLAHGAHVTECRVVAGGEHEPHPHLLNALRNAVGLEIDPRAEGLQHVGAAAR